MIYRPVEGYPNNGVYVNVSENVEFSTKIQCDSTGITSATLKVYDGVTFSSVKQASQTSSGILYNNGDTLSISLSLSNLKINYPYYWNVELKERYPDIFYGKTKIIQYNLGVPVIPKDSFSDNLYSNNNYLGKYVENPTTGEKFAINGMELTSYGVSTPGYLLDLAGTMTYVGDIKIYTNTVNSIDFPFYIGQKPSVSMNIQNGDVITSKSKEIVLTNNLESLTSGVFSPNQIKWFRLWLKDSDDVILKDTKEIYSQSLKYEFDGLLNNTTYKIGGKVCSINGLTSDITDKQVFVSYDSPKLNLPVRATIIEEKDAVKLEWSDSISSHGIATGTYEFVDDEPIEEKKSLKILSGSVIYNSIGNLEMRLPDEFTLFTDIIFDETKQGDILELNGIQEIEIQSGTAIVTYGKSIKASIKGNIFTIFNSENGMVVSRYILSSFASGQTEEGAVANNYYIWEDSDILDDDKVWTETLPFTKRYKIKINNTSANIWEVTNVL